MPSLLYVGELGPGQTSQDRADALVDLGASVETIACPSYAGISGKLDWVLSSRLQISQSISALNKAIVAKLSERPCDILWLDKGWLIRPATLHAIRSKVSAIVLFSNDNPWGQHERGMWRLHKRIIPLVDEIIVPRYSIVRPYELAGARRVSVVDFGFAPARHFEPGMQRAKQHDLCFIGTALKDGGGIRPHRIELIRELGKRLPGLLSIFGHGWQRSLKGAERYFKIIDAGVYGDRYRETIWDSRINLSFVTKDYWDETSHKAYEITACGSCLLAERSSRLEQNFVEGKEAVFFNSVDECAMLATQLLSDASKREHIARAGHRRAVTSGYDNQSRLRDAIARSPVLKPYFPTSAQG